jgi:AcrR family transcriptional regulator
LPGKALPMEPASTVVHRRENGKLDKRRRINEAARAVFTEFGYKRASMREIARRAGVATGTLFLYAPDKRNLLLWIVNDDLARVTAKTFGDVKAGRVPGDLLTQLVHVFEARYHYGSTYPDLSLHALQELVMRRNLNGAPLPDPEHDQQVLVMRDSVAYLVRAHQRLGPIRTNEDPEAIARLILAVYHAAIRNWLRDSVDVAEGVAELRLLLRLAIEGVAALPLSLSKGQGDSKEDGRT